MDTKTTYWDFLQKYHIVIPKIQRDYAQGRIGKKDLRKRFLGNLQNAITKRQELILDFVYGMQNDKVLIPLDGQQRLTTLWLLHWYAYLLHTANTVSNLKTSKDKNKDKEDPNLKLLKEQFTYETRVSSREFCQALCNEEYFTKLKDTKGKEIRNIIENQIWFMSEWKQDPTVKSMLTMLGGNISKKEKGNNSMDECIEDVFSDKTDLWGILTKDCPIVFYYLPLDGNGLQQSDDIYIKMNARGEQLTDFENFKADLIKHVRDAKQEDWSQVVENTYKQKPEIGLSKLIDTDWTDIFWNEQTGNNKNVDIPFFAFLNRFFLNQVLVSPDINEKKLKTKENPSDTARFFQYIYGDKGDADTTIKYSSFDIYPKARVINPQNFNKIKNIFQVIKDHNEDIKTHLNPIWEGEEDCLSSVLPIINQEDSIFILEGIKQIPRVVFYGICCYLEKCNNPQDLNSESFKVWMRFVWNMARNSDIQTVDSMIGVMNVIKEASPNTHTILVYLKDHYSTPADNDTQEKEESSYRKRQFREECWKANILSKNLQLKEFIDEAEKVFHGSIRFLLTDNCSLLSKEYIEKAIKLLKQDKWYQTLLPYLDDQIEDNEIITFTNKQDDVVKAINYNDKIITAVQDYLLDTTKCKQFNKTDSWIYPLVTIKDAEHSLMDYSTTKRVRKYFWWNNDNPTGIYLYKGSQWKKEDCILLASKSQELQKMINQRNGFIKNKLEAEKWELCIEDDNLDNKKISPEDENKHYGRAIVLKNGNQLCYCAVDGYCDEKNSDKQNYN